MIWVAKPSATTSSPAAVCMVKKISTPSPAAPPQTHVPTLSSRLPRPLLLNAGPQNPSPDSLATVSFETSVQIQLQLAASVDQVVLATSGRRGGSHGDRSVAPVLQVSVALPQDFKSLL